MHKSKLSAKIIKSYPLKRDTFTCIPNEVITLDSKHVSDGIGKAWYKWIPATPIIINCPTGAGKNYFIENVLINYSIRNGKTVLICSNRITLDLAIKQRVCERLNIFKGFNDAALHSISEYESIHIYSYQQLIAAIRTDKFKNLKFDYAIFDEVHYFTSDSSFSIGAGSLLQKIPEVFRSAVRIYMSATIDEILPYIYESENNVNKRCRSIFFGKPTPILPKLYRMKADYSHIRLRFYTKDEVAERIIKKSSGKSIIFVDSKAYGKQLHEMFEDSLYIDSDTKQNCPEIISDLVKKECFDSKLLISTAVFENGCNICDLEVKNVFIQDISPSSILQMAGRRRILLDDDAFNLYLKVPERDTLFSRLSKLEKILDAIEMSKSNPTEFMRFVLNPDWLINDIRKIAYAYKEKYRFDWLTVEMLTSRRNYITQILNLITNEGVEEYCQAITSKLFDMEFMPVMLLCSDTENTENMIEYLHNFAGKKVNITELQSIFSKFKQWYTEKFGPSKSDNRGKSRQDNINYNLFNNRLQEFDLPFMWTRTDDNYILREFKI